ncbi:KGK domain-containing protein [Leptolyngbya sp. AN02str]|uniref:KGK domain-containing protein n=1 Tax=Leptolyngbya sp. AN02str TaxID=3423363 RepID=UPI003D32192B
MDRDYSLLSDDEVLHIRSGRILMPNATFKVSEFLDALAQVISEQEAEWSDECEGWFSTGLRCEALRLANQGWQRGRVRIRLEFYPEPQKLLKEETPRHANRSERPAYRDEVYTTVEPVYDEFNDEY